MRDLGSRRRKLYTRVAGQISGLYAYSDSMPRSSRPLRPPSASPDKVSSHVRSHRDSLGICRNRQAQRRLQEALRQNRGRFSVSALDKRPARSLHLPEWADLYSPRRGSDLAADARLVAALVEDVLEMMSGDFPLSALTSPAAYLNSRSNPS